MDKITLDAELRSLKGRKVKKLREKGFMPANIFGKKIKSKAISIKLDDFSKVYQDAGETGLISLKIKGDKEIKDSAVLISNVQMHPVDDVPVHVDFHQVDLKEKVTADVPVELTGISPAEKQSLGTVVQYIDEIEVEALPTDLPEKFIIDISKLEEVDQAVFVKDLDFDKAKVQVKAGLEEIVVKVEPPQKEEVIEAPAPEPEGVEGEVPVEGENVSKEGESEVKEDISKEAPKE